MADYKDIPTPDSLAERVKLILRLLKYNSAQDFIDYMCDKVQPIAGTNNAATPAAIQTFMSKAMTGVIASRSKHMPRLIKAANQLFRLNGMPYTVTEAWLRNGQGTLMFPVGERKPVVTETKAAYSNGVLPDDLNPIIAEPKDKKASQETLDRAYCVNNDKDTCELHEKGLCAAGEECKQRREFVLTMQPDYDMPPPKISREGKGASEFLAELIEIRITELAECQNKKLELLERKIDAQNEVLATMEETLERILTKRA